MSRSCTLFGQKTNTLNIYTINRTEDAVNVVWLTFDKSATLINLYHVSVITLTVVLHELIFTINADDLQNVVSIIFEVILCVLLSK